MAKLADFGALEYILYYLMIIGEAALTLLLSVCCVVDNAKHL